MKQESKIKQRRATNRKAYHTVANHLYSRLKRLTKKSILTAQKEELPLCYIKFVLLTMKTTKDSNIYYLVRCNHETLQKLFSWPVYMKGIGKKEEREKLKSCSKFTRLSYFL